MLQNPQVRLKLVTSRYTHVSFGLQRTGLHQDVYQIGVLTFKASFTIEKLLHRNHAQSSCMIFGRVLDPELQPSHCVINRDKRDMTVLGPNRIYYDNKFGNDFRIFCSNF